MWVERCKLNVKKIYTTATVEPFKLGCVPINMQTKQDAYNYVLRKSAQPIINWAKIMYIQTNKFICARCSNQEKTCQ